MKPVPISIQFWRDFTSNTPVSALHRKKLDFIGISPLFLLNLKEDEETKPFSKGTNHELKPQKQDSNYLYHLARIRFNYVKKVKNTLQLRVKAKEKVSSFMNTEKLTTLLKERIPWMYRTQILSESLNHLSPLCTLHITRLRHPVNSKYNKSNKKDRKKMYRALELLIGI